MYIQYAVSFVMALPMAVYYGQHKVSNPGMPPNVHNKSMPNCMINDTTLHSNLLNDTNDTSALVSDICHAPDLINDTNLESRLAIPESCNCSSRQYQFSAADVITQLIEMNIPKEDRVEIVNMLDELDWIKETGTNWDFVRMYSFCKESGILEALFINASFFLVTYVIMQKSVIGIFVKIFIHHLTSIPNYFYRLVKDIAVKCHLITGVPSFDGSIDDDSFVECSSIIMKGIETEEVQAKRNDLEERSTVDTSITSNISTDTFTFNDSDEGYGTISTILESTRQESPREIPGPSGQTRLASREKSLEKFKTFLRMKHDDIKKAGISFTDEGYVLDPEDFPNVPNLNMTI